MATNKTQEELLKQQQQAQQQANQKAQQPAVQAYQPNQQVTAAQQAMQQAQQQKPASYTPGANVQQAQTALQSLQNTKPEAYTSKYGAQLDSILGQITAPKEFKYTFDGDELFKYYADLYTQKGKQASQDARGQAAALTGGYGNSYGQQVANQTYDQYLLSLYDKGMDLRDRAYQQYQDQLADQYNQYNALMGADATDYDRYRDLVGDWQGERDYLTGRYDTERAFDYGQYQDALAAWQADRDYLTGRYDTERNFDYGAYMDAQQMAEQQRQFDAQLNENIRQFNESLNWDKMSSDQKYAAQYALSILQSGQMPSEELLRQAGLSAEDAKKLMAQIGGGGRGSGTNVYVTDALGNIYLADANGQPIKGKDGYAVKADWADVKSGDLVNSYYQDNPMSSGSPATANMLKSANTTKMGTTEETKVNSGIAKSSASQKEDKKKK